MHILHFSTADNEGGSARSAYRIHTALRSRGHSSHMLVGKKVTDDADVELIAGNALGRYLDIFIDRYNRSRGQQYFSVPSSRRLLAHPWLQQADIIQLYNTHGGYFSHMLLPELSRRAPLVWRLSDMWPMTAHAAYSYGCECYKKGPEVCVCALDSYPGIGRDTKKMLWEAKERVYAQLKNLTIVAPSSFLEKAARESKLLGKFPVVRIPNGIDTRVFSPQNKAEARAALGIPHDVRVVLFSAHGLDNNPRKGSEELKKMLNALGPQKNILLVLVGEGGESFRVPFPVRLCGYIADRVQLANIYSAADILLLPSMAENLPNNLLEAMACGLPAVAFDTGGIGDAVKHMETGYLARSGDQEDFVKGLQLMMEKDTLRDAAGRAARTLMEKEFSQEKEIERFEALYEKLLTPNA